MATKGRGTRRGASKPPLTREFHPAQRLGELDPRSLTRRLYELHAAARPGGLDDWPGDGDLWRVLGYTQLCRRRQRTSRPGPSRGRRPTPAPTRGFGASARR